MVSSVRPLRTLGRYALYEPIASGGMATVHLGRLLGPVGFGRTVAIKRLHENFARDPQFVAMFVDEARLAARVQHPNVVDMLDLITTDGELFLVLGYVPGEALSTLFRAARTLDRTIPLGVLAGIMVGVLDGLHAAHEARSEQGEPLGIVHRDVSPHNVLVGVDGIPRLLDFGVAKAAGRMQQSRSGELKGKLAYMAPEQVSGAADRRTDVYSASVILWEGLTGRRLVHGDNDAMLLRQLLAGKTDPPSLHRAGIPPELDALVLRGLAAEPDDRFATAREMARALEQVTAVVSAAVMGDWVESLVHDRLADRARQVELVEQSSVRFGSSHSPAPPRDPSAAPGERATTPLGDITRSLPGAAPSQASPRDLDAMPTQLSSAHSFESRRSFRSVRSLALYGTIGIAALAFWGVQRATRPSIQGSPAPSAAPAVTASPPWVPSASATTVPSPAPEPSSVAAAADAMAPMATSGSAAPRRPAGRPTQAATPARAARDLQRAIDTRK